MHSMLCKMCSRVVKTDSLLALDVQCQWTTVVKNCVNHDRSGNVTFMHITMKEFIVL